jgi:hypothetical protein
MIVWGLGMKLYSSYQLRQNSSAISRGACENFRANSCVFTTTPFMYHCEELCFMSIAATIEEYCRTSGVEH